MVYGIWYMAIWLYSIFYILYSARRSRAIGVHGDEETPVLIPNTAVKLVSGDYTAQAGN